MFDCPRDRTAQRLIRGIGRALEARGFAWISEFTLPDGRRADIAALDEKGAIWIVEIKSGPADFRADGKWTAYEAWCDGFAFGVGPDFPQTLLPVDRGLFVSDGHDAALVRPLSGQKLAAARRHALTRRFARTAANRLQGQDGVSEPRAV